MEGRAPQSRDWARVAAQGRGGKKAKGNGGSSLNQRDSLPFLSFGVSGWFRGFGGSFSNSSNPRCYPGLGLFYSSALPPHLRHPSPGAFPETDKTACSGRRFSPRHTYYYYISHAEATLLAILKACHSSSLVEPVTRGGCLIFPHPSFGCLSFFFLIFVYPSRHRHLRHLVLLYLSIRFSR